MSKKIQGNSVCHLCKSGLKYKECCGKNKGVRPTTIEYIADDKTYHSEFDKKIYEKISHYPNEYIKPIKNIKDIIYVLIDESNVGEYYSVSGIVIKKSDIEKNIIIQHELQLLVEKYNIDYIHFTDIFGSNKIIGNNKINFIYEYADIVGKLDLKPFAVCMKESEIKEWLKQDEITKDICYNALTWKMMFNIISNCIYEYGTELIFEMWRESDNVTNEKRILHQINIKEIIDFFPFANISIYKDYMLFTKRKILFSSLSDFVAYLTCKIYSKLDSGVPESKILKNYYDLLNVFDKIFKDTIGMRNKQFDNIISSIREKKVNFSKKEKK